MRQTETEEEQLKEGEAFDPMADAAAGGVARQLGESGGQQQAGDFANLDFLEQGSAVLLNLTPDDDGVVAIPRDQLGPHPRIWIVAVDPDDTACRRLSLEETEAAYQDLRLAENLDTGKHFTQQKSISVVNEDQTFELSDISSASFETYDSLTKVHALLVTLSENETLAEFSFILNWDQLTPEQKRDKYSKYACHELSFFLARKDPEFFRRVVLPFLKNKKDKTFLDNWLIDEQLAAYLDVWNYQQLNVAERILLAQRVRRESPHTSRWVRDQFDLLPPDVERFDFLFGTAVKGSALDADDELGLEEAKQSLKLGRLDSERDRMDSKGIPRSSAGQAGRPAAPAAAEPPPAEATEKLARKSEMANRRGEDRNGVADKQDGAYFYARLPESESERRLYVQMDKTQEWAENNYYHLPIEQQNADLVKVNCVSGATWPNTIRANPSSRSTSPQPPTRSPK